MKDAHINDGWLDTTSTEEREILDFRAEGFGPVLSLGRFRYHNATEPLVDQQHDDWLVLVFALEGVQHYRVGDSDVLLRAGQMMRVLPEQRYGTGPWPEQRGALAWMILRINPSPSGRGLGMDSKTVRTAFNRLTGHIGQLVFKQPAMTGSVLDDVFASWEGRGDSLRREVIRHQLAALILQAAVEVREDEQGDRGGIGYADARVHAVIDWLGANFHEKICTEKLVETSRLSASLFFREFRRVTGMTPKDYILRLRVEEAARLLRNEPSLPVISIAYDLGFSSSQYFATVFRRYLGVSPGDYRTTTGVMSHR